jgi:hypothetical protein
LPISSFSLVSLHPKLSAVEATLNPLTTGEEAPQKMVIEFVTPKLDHTRDESE